MTALAFISSFESVQFMIVLGVGAVVFAAVVAYGWRKQSNADHRHKMETLEQAEKYADANARRTVEARQQQEQLAQMEFNRRVAMKQLNEPVNIDHSADEGR